MFKLNRWIRLKKTNNILSKSFGEAYGKGVIVTLAAPGVLEREDSTWLVNCAPWRGHTKCCQPDSWLRAAKRPALIGGCPERAHDGALLNQWNSPWVDTSLGLRLTDVVSTLWTFTAHKNNSRLHFGLPLHMSANIKVSFMLTPKLVKRKSQWNSCQT